MPHRNEVGGPPSRGHKKRERTRNQLMVAGLRVLAEKGEALTISDVVAAAEVSNGTFYNYFADRGELIHALAEHSLITLAAQTAMEISEHDPALRFAISTGRILKRAEEDRVWAGAVVRLLDEQRSVHREVGRYLQEDLATGYEQGRFSLGPDEITLDLLLGFFVLSIRRILRGEARVDHVERVLERALTLLGLPADEASDLARRALADPIPSS